MIIVLPHLLVAVSGYGDTKPSRRLLESPRGEAIIGITQEDKDQRRVTLRAFLAPLYPVQPFGRWHRYE